ncbi:MAG TPA: radical SAM protein, partial [Spirochaetota bacterium]|nr:radical SAM protein [Spirochaetota bacterium]
MILKTNKNATFRWMSRTESQDVSGEITRVQVELSTFCNMSCRACVRSSIRDFAPRHLTTATAKKIAASLAGLPSLETIVLLGFGEPLCNPSFKKILAGFTALNKRMTLVSNGALMDASTADFLFSIPLSELYLSWDDDITGTDPLRNREGLAAQVVPEARRPRDQL